VLLAGVVVTRNHPRPVPFTATAWIPRIKRPALMTVLLYALSLPVIIGGAQKLEAVLSAPSAQATWITQRYHDHLGLSILHVLPGVIF